MRDVFISKRLCFLAPQALAKAFQFREGGEGTTVVLQERIGHCSVETVPVSLDVSPGRVVLRLLSHLLSEVG
jgi:hypothetical protein